MTSSLRLSLCALAFAGLLAPALASAAAPAPPVAGERSSIVIQGQDGWLFPGWGSLTDVDARGIEASAAMIESVDRGLAARGTKLVVLVLPDKVHFYGDKLPAGTATSQAVRDRYQTIQSALSRHGVTSVDAMAALRAVQTLGEPVFYRTDQHWTLAAADAAALATALQVQKVAPILQGNTGTGSALAAPVTERRYGDLAELFLSPQERRAVGRDTYLVRRSDDRLGLLDSPDTPVHITGHSMVQPYYGYPQKLSNLLDRPVSLNWKPGNVGHWAVLLEYLESPAFRAHPPQVLVWQLFEPTFHQPTDAAGIWDNASLMDAATWQRRLGAALAP